MELYFTGLVMGLASFIITGIFHPVVVKMEYHYGKQSWRWLLIPGIVVIILSLFLSPILSILAGVFGFALVWSSIEIIKQHKRVLDGRAAKNPLRSYE